MSTTTNKHTDTRTPTIHVLETDGEVCPFPLVEAKIAIEQIPSGDRLRINFDCTQGTEAIPRWAAEHGYPVVDFQRVGDAGWTITVAKP